MKRMYLTYVNKYIAGLQILCTANICLGALFTQELIHSFKEPFIILTMTNQMIAPIEPKGRFILG